MPICLNIGCGTAKYDGFINIDSNPKLDPDVVCDIRTEGLAKFENDSVDKIWFIHTIEHIEEKYHIFILSEFNRVLKLDGELVVGYPEFTTCAKFYIENKRGCREYWKATIYGRQNYASDYHVSLMDSNFFVPFLKSHGFANVEVKTEAAPHEINVLVKCTKERSIITREELYRKEIFQV